MDSKDEEQARGITMKSSSISLLFVPGAATLALGPNTMPQEARLEQGRPCRCWGCCWGCCECCCPLGNCAGTALLPAPFAHCGRSFNSF